MKAAVSEFITNLAPYKGENSHVAISLIPFGGNVNFGPQGVLMMNLLTGLKFSDAYYGCFRNDGDLLGVWHTSFQAYQQGYVNGSPLCPSDNSKVTLFSYDEQALIAQVKAMDMSYGTDTPKAMLWAERMLDNQWRNRTKSFAENNPEPITDSTEKIIVLLTDGAVAIVDDNEDGNLDGKKLRRRSTSESIQVFKQQCETLGHVPNLNLYTIGFELKAGETSDALKDCIVGNGQHFQAGTDDLNSVFNKINDQIAAVRIVR